jgi:hypothetical protein
MGANQAHDFRDLSITANQLGNRRRQVRRRRGRRGLRRDNPRTGALVQACRQNPDLAGELVTASRDCADELALRREGGAQRRNLGCHTIFPDDPARPHARHQRVLADDGSAALDQRHQHVERAPAELDRPAVGEQLAAVRQQLEATERDTRRWLGGGIHSRGS